MKITMKKIMQEINASPIGGDTATGYGSVLGNVAHIYCWDGRRYVLVLKPLPKGKKISTKTGKLIK